MRKRIEWNWEKLDQSTYRAMVIGGWLVLHTNFSAIRGGKKDDMVQTESMVFVLDRDHEWFIQPPVDEAEAKKIQVTASDFK